MFLVFSLLLPVPLRAEQWDAVHHEMLHRLAELSRNHFAFTAMESPSVSEESNLLQPYIVVVGFTGGIEKKDSKASGIAGMGKSLQARLAGDSAVLPLTFNNMRWRRARTEVLRIVQDMRQGTGFPHAMRQPLIIVYGHSWGAGSISKFARELEKENVEISLAIYIDAFVWRGIFGWGRNPKVPGNVRYAINSYQRAGIFRGLPIRGKSKVVPEDEQATRILGNFKITPQTEAWGWNWRNPLQGLLYRQHHLIAHDHRLESFLLDLVTRMQLDVAKQMQPAPQLASADFRSDQRNMSEAGKESRRQ
ncbi:MAG: hypothetical protein HYX72_07865 [Acidobacteria bacterium]|nr:hypothetical protein [Acidobacteriota bacterium]